jgi:hypothetical protein
LHAEFWLQMRSTLFCIKISPQILRIKLTHGTSRRNELGLLYQFRAPSP